MSREEQDARLARQTQQQIAYSAARAAERENTVNLITKTQQAQLLENGDNPEGHKPVVKLFTPWGGATWLISEIDPHDHDQWFGLCDLGQGYPELGWVSISEITSVRGPGGLKVERDLHFTADKSLEAYADAARVAGRIIA